jgi:deoxyribonuclease V
MDVRALHPWPATADEAEALQLRLRPLVDLTPADGLVQPKTVAGLDVAYEDCSDRVAAAAVVLDTTSLAVVEQVVWVGRARFPYRTGLFAFREAPALVSALERLTTVPDLLLCDGHGIAHPRRFGLACHLGLLTGRPTVGVGKKPLTGLFDGDATAIDDGLGDERGATRPLYDRGELLGVALRTQDGVRPVYVSPGHLVDVETSWRLVLGLTPRYRLPEPIRMADHASRQALRELPT